MGCNCGKKQGVAYQVTLPDGTTKKVSSVGEAQSVLTAAGGGTFKAVAK